MSLESEVKDSVWSRFFRKSMILGTALLMPYSLAPFSPGLVPLAKAFTYPIMAGRIAGNWATNRPALEGIIKESVGSTAASAVIPYGLNKASELERVISPRYGEIVGRTAIAAAYVGIATPLSTFGHTIFNYGIEKNFWSRYKERVITNFKWTTIPVMMKVSLINYLGMGMQMLFGGLINATFSFLQKIYGGHAKLSNLYRNMKKSLNPIPAMKEMYHSVYKGISSIFRPPQPQYSYA